MPKNANNNVISLTKYESERRNAGNGVAIRALEEVRELCCHRFSENLQYMMTKCDDALYGCAQLAESRVVEKLYLDAIHELKAIGGDLEKRFIERFVEQFNLGTPRYTQYRNTFERHAEQDFSDIPYLKRERASEEIAICKMIERTRSQCAESLVSLDRRIGLLLQDHELELWKNPLSPEPICEAFRTTVSETVKELKHGFEMRPVLFNLFAEYVLGDMDMIYQEVNFHLIKLGVQPGLSASHFLPGNDIETSGHQEATLSINPEQDTDVTAVQEIIQAESRFSDEGCGDDDQPAVHQVKPQPSADERPESHAVSGDPGDITMDVVAMMFEHILENRNMPDSMRILLGRLQIPMVKIAIQEQHFFSDKAHPARLLLNRLAECASGWDERFGHEDALYRKIEAIVHALLNGYEQDARLFEALLKDLEDFLATRKTPASISVRNPVDVMEGEERLKDARTNAVEQVEKHVSGDGSNLEFIHDFLTTQWKDLLLLIHARQGKACDDWRRALSTMDDLVWSVKPKNSMDEHQHLLAMQPALFNSLREGMHRLSVSVTEQDEFLARLMRAQACTYPGIEQMEQETAYHNEGRKKARVGIVAKNHTGDFKAKMQSTAVDDRFTIQARQLQPGGWIEITGRDGKSRRIKLSWISPITKTCLFIDQTGLNAGNYSIEELAQLLRSAQARILPRAR